MNYSHAFSQTYTISKSDTSEVRFVNARKFYFYKVEKGETMYSLSKKFNIPQEEIIQFNPDLKESGLKAKMKLWIPAYSWLNRDTQEKVQSSTSAGAYTKSKKKVVVFTTVNLHKAYLGNSDDSSFIPEPLNPVVKENLEFIEGILYSAKNHIGRNPDIEVLIVDLEDDSSKVSKLFRRQEISEADAIITNENGLNLRLINQFSIKNQIPVFCTAINSSEILHANPLAFSFIPSSLSQCRIMGQKAAEMFQNAQCILIKTALSKENERTDAFRSGWASESKNTVFKTIRSDKDGFRAIRDSLSKNKVNVVFLPTSNEDQISSMFNVIRDWKKDYIINIVGLPTWSHSQNLDGFLMDELNVHLFTAGYIDYKDSRVSEFRKNFRDNYHTEPGESAFMGADVYALMLHTLKLNSVRKDQDKKKIFSGMYSNYLFENDAGKDCGENQVIHVLKFENALPVRLQLKD